MWGGGCCFFGPSWHADLSPCRADLSADIRNFSVYRPDSKTCSEIRVVWELSHNTALIHIPQGGILTLFLGVSEYRPDCVSTGLEYGACLWGSRNTALIQIPQGGILTLFLGVSEYRPDCISAQGNSGMIVWPLLGPFWGNQGGML